MHQGHANTHVAVTSAYHHMHPAAAGNVAAQHQAVGAAQQNAQQQQQVVMNAAGGQAMFDDDDDLDRDWLDMSYMLIRFSLLLMIVYFYSSFTRFAVVFSLFALIYM